MASALATVLEPRPGAFGSSAVDLDNIMNYTGDELAVQSLRDTLTDQNKDNAWTGLMDELLTKGQQTIALLPEADTLTSKMSAINSREEALAPGTFQLLTEALTSHAKFKNEMRAGLLKEYESQMQGLGLLVAQEITTGPELEVAVSPGDVTSVQKLLTQFSSKETNQAFTSLERWRKISQQKLQIGGFEQLVSNYPLQVSAELGPEMVAQPSLDKFLSAVKGIEISSSVQLDNQAFRAAA